MSEGLSMRPVHLFMAVIKSTIFRIDNVDSPISIYAATKKSNELMAHVYNHLYGI